MNPSRIRNHRVTTNLDKESPLISIGTCLPEYLELTLEIVAKRTFVVFPQVSSVASASRSYRGLTSASSVRRTADEKVEGRKFFYFSFFVLSSLFFLKPQGPHFLKPQGPLWNPCLSA